MPSWHSSRNRLILPFGRLAVDSPHYFIRQSDFCKFGEEEEEEAKTKACPPVQPLLNHYSFFTFDHDSIKGSSRFALAAAMSTIFYYRSRGSYFAVHKKGAGRCR